MKTYVVVTRTESYINAENEQDALDKYNHQYENAVNIIMENYNQHVEEA